MFDGKTGGQGRRRAAERHAAIQSITASFHKRGATICPNNHSVWMGETDAEVMRAVQEEILDPLVIEAALAEAMAALSAPTTLDRLPEWKGRIAELDREME